MVVLLVFLLILGTISTSSRPLYWWAAVAADRGPIRCHPIHLGIVFLAAMELALTPPVA